MFTFSSPTTPTDVYVWDVRGETVERVTEAALAGIPADPFVAPELAFYPSFDGTTIPAFLYVPPGVKEDRSPPAVVYAHGGPEVQERPYFDAVFQYFLDAGYAVFAPNFRGSKGYGQTYADADNVENRMDAVLDVYEGWWFLAEQPWCDRFKVAIYGSSYGGFMVLSQLTQRPYHWAAGIDIVGIANLVTFLENTGPWRVSLREDEYGSLPGGPRAVGGLLTHRSHRRHPLAADGCPRRQRPARAGGRGRANSRGGAYGPGRGQGRIPPL